MSGGRRGSGSNGGGVSFLSALKHSHTVIISPSCSKSFYFLRSLFKLVGYQAGILYDLPVNDHSQCLKPAHFPSPTSRTRVASARTLCPLNTSADQSSSSPPKSYSHAVLLLFPAAFRPEYPRNTKRSTLLLRFLNLRRFI